MEGIRLSRQALPTELVSKNDDLYQLMVYVGDMSPNDPLRPESLNKTRAFLRRACHSYKPSYGPDVLACRSGEINGKPFRGEACGKCVAGQWSRSMVFVGEIRPATPQPAAIEIAA